MSKLDTCIFAMKLGQHYRKKESLYTSNSLDSSIYVQG